MDPLAAIHIVATFGSAAMAGYTTAIRIVHFALMPAFGLGAAAATMLGQSLGARDPARAERAVWLAAQINVVVLGPTRLGFLVFALVNAALYRRGSWKATVL